MFLDPAYSPYFPLLVPDEYCLAEEENALVDLYAQRKGFHIFGGFTYKNVPAMVYVTNYRVSSM